MLKLADLRKTTRRSGSGDLRTVYPRFLRDRALVPRIDMAIRYLEGMLGRPRRELDDEVIVQLFGDHKLARCVVACLAASYRHRPLTFAEVLPPEQCASLLEAGIATPSDLRLWLYRYVNRAHAGFASAEQRSAILHEAGDAFGLKPRQIEQLIGLDQPANAVLARLAPKPTADDLLARFNYETAAALLASASLVRISLARVPSNAAALRALCARSGVSAELSGRELVLHGRQDAMGSWVRMGTRLVRLLSDLLVCGLPARSGEALIAAPDGGEWRFRLDAEVFADLGAPEPSAPPAYDADLLLAMYGRAETLPADYAALRRAGGTGGWALRRTNEPLIHAGTVMPAFFVAIRSGQRVPLVAARVDAATGAVSPRRPLVALLPEGAATSQPAEQAMPTLRYSHRADVAALPGLLAYALGEAERTEGAALVASVIAEAAEAGVLAEPRLAERLGCAEEDVWAWLARPAARAACQERGLEYVEGFGLCTADVLRRAHSVASEVAVGQGSGPAEPVRAVRVLGRRLREVTGASEGIECLIAYLGAA